MKKKRSKLQWLACLLVAAVMMTAGAPQTTAWALDDNPGEQTATVDLVEDKPKGGAGGSGGSSGSSWGFGSIWNSIKNVFVSSSQSSTIGPDFVPGGNTVQLGVNPNSLIPTKDLSTLDSQRINNAVKYGGDKPIIVDANGTVLDGHHRLKYAIDNNKAVDTSIGY